MQDLQRFQPLLGRTCVRFPFPALFLVQKGQRRSDSDALPEGTKEVEIAQHPFPTLRKHRHGRVISVEKIERPARRLSPIRALAVHVAHEGEQDLLGIYNHAGVGWL